MATDTLSLSDGNLNKETPSRQANPTLFPMGDGWEETCQWSPKHPEPRPVYLGTKRKENPSYATPSPPRLKSTYLSIPRTFPSGREPSLLILFHMARHLIPVCDWPHASRRISQKRDSEIPLLSQSPLRCIRRSGGGKQKMRHRMSGQPMWIPSSKANTNYSVNEALKQGWSVSSRIIRPVFLLSVRECNWQRVEVRR